MAYNLYTSILQAKQQQQKQFVVLLDPDKLRLSNIDRVLHLASQAKVDYFFVGGSLVVSDMLDQCIKTIKSSTSIPVILFPGDISQINYSADAILYLSLISGRNPDLLIGKHVVSAPLLYKSKLEIISTGYMLIDGGRSTTASYMSGTFPLPADKEDIALCTALAGEMLGMKLIYMDAGSGAQNPISERMISTVAEHISIPLVIGGGIRTPEKALKNVQAGADVIVIGNAIEKDPILIAEMAAAIHSMNAPLVYSK